MTSSFYGAGPAAAQEKQTQTYEAFGFRLRSSLDLTGLRPVSHAGDPDVVIERGAVVAPGALAPGGFSGWPGRDGDVIAWKRGTRLRIQADAITVDTSEEAFARQCVSGPGLGILAHRRGLLTLHGSAVEVDGRAVVLLGPKRAGKSTAAAALVARGHRLLTDDLVVLDLDEEGARVRLGPTQVKLWPASSEVLGLSDAVEPIVDGFAKGVWHGAPPAEAKAPVALVCSLGWGDAIEVTPLTASAAFSAVFAHVYAPRFLRASVSGSLVAPVARLVALVRVAALSRPADLGRVEETVAALEGAVGG